MRLVFHVAADYRCGQTSAEMYQSNVDGTRNMLRAAQAAGASASFIPARWDASASRRGIGDENQPVSIDDMTGAYKRSKFMAEQIALGFARGGLPVVIVNRQRRWAIMTSSRRRQGRLWSIFCAAQCRLISTRAECGERARRGAGTSAGVREGRVGERYILGAANMTLGRFCTSSHRSRPKAPTIELPYFVA